MSTTDIPAHPITNTDTNPMRSAFKPLPTFDVIVTDTMGDHVVPWTDGADALWEYKDIIEEQAKGQYPTFLAVRIEFNGTVFREQVFPSADL